MDSQKCNCQERSGTAPSYAEIKVSWLTKKGICRGKPNILRRFLCFALLCFSPLQNTKQPLQSFNVHITSGTPFPALHPARRKFLAGTCKEKKLLWRFERDVVKTLKPFNLFLSTGNVAAMRLLSVMVKTVCNGKN